MGTEPENTLLNAIVNESIDSLKEGEEWILNINQPIGKKPIQTGSGRNVINTTDDVYPLEVAVKTNNLALVQFLLSKDAQYKGFSYPPNMDARIRVLLDLKRYIENAPGKSPSKVETAKELFSVLCSEPISENTKLADLKIAHAANLSKGRLGDIFQKAETAFSNEKPSLSHGIVKNFFDFIANSKVEEAQKLLQVYPELCNRASETTGQRWVSGGGSRTPQAPQKETYDRLIYPLESAVQENNVAMVKSLLKVGINSVEGEISGSVFVKDPNDYAYRLALGGDKKHPNPCASGLTPNPHIALLLELHHYIKLREVEADLTGFARAFSCFSIFKCLLPLQEDKTVKSMKLDLATRLLDALCDDSPQEKLKVLSDGLSKNEEIFIKDGRLGELFTKACQQHNVEITNQAVKPNPFS